MNAKNRLICSHDEPERSYTHIDSIHKAIHIYESQQHSFIHFAGLTTKNKLTKRDIFRFKEKLEAILTTQSFETLVLMTGVETRLSFQEIVEVFYELRAILNTKTIRIASYYFGKDPCSLKYTGVHFFKYVYQMNVTKFDIHVYEPITEEQDILKHLFAFIPYLKQSQSLNICYSYAKERNSDLLRITKEASDERIIVHFGDRFYTKTRVIRIGRRMQMFGSKFKLVLSYPDYLISKLTSLPECYEEVVTRKPSLKYEMALCCTYLINQRDVFSSVWITGLNSLFTLKFLITQQFQLKTYSTKRDSYIALLESLEQCSRKEKDMIHLIKFTSVLQDSRYYN